MSQHLWNIHNYSKSPQAQPSVYGLTKRVSDTDSADEVSPQSPEQDDLPTEQHVNQAEPVSTHSQNQPTSNKTVEFTTWREKASIEDWKAFLLSASAAAHQAPQLQRRQTQYNLNTDSKPNRIARQHPTAYVSYSSPYNNGYRTLVHETKRNSGAIDNRRAFMEKLRANHAAVKDWFQAQLQEQRMRQQYPPGLIERIRLEKERLRAGIAHIETLMRHPNEQGYVMLDDRAISVLVTIIDRILPKDLNLEMLIPQTYDY